MAPPTPLRIALHVRPGSSAPGVGGTFDDALVVRVRARATEGRATAEAIDRLARALSVPASRIHLERGSRSRHKVVRVETADPTVHDTLARLRATPPAPTS